MIFPIIDFHADLLSYLSYDQSFTENDPASNCSLVQLEQGNVKLQILPIFTKTQESSSLKGLKQANFFKKLKEKSNSKTEFLLAIENASSLIDENEALDNIFYRLKLINNPIIYLSMTWNQENRFGGGCETKIGLKNDGKILLEYLSHKNIAIDLSHASDFLVSDVINYIEKNNLSTIPIASHSNCRAICDRPRNLPDEFINYIIKKRGIIGINFVQYFVGNSPKDFFKHLQHLKELKGENNTVLGADFFSPIILGPIINTLSPILPIYFNDFNNASSYPKFTDFLQLQLPLNFIEKVTYINALNFLKQLPQCNQTIDKIFPNIS